MGDVIVEKMPNGAVYITHGGVRMRMVDWARHLGIPKETMIDRVRRGVIDERLLSRSSMRERHEIVDANGRSQTLTEWAREFGVYPSVLCRRIQRHGVDKALSADAFPVKCITKREGTSWWPELDHPWEDDPRAQYVVAHHPDGITLDEVGLLLGVTRERVRQIEESALRKLKNQHGSREVVAFLLEQSKERESRAKQVVYPECLGFGEAAAISSMALHGKSKKSAA